MQIKVYHMLSGIAVEKKKFGYYGIVCDDDKQEECRECVGALGKIIMDVKGYIMVLCEPDKQTKFLKLLKKYCRMSDNLYFASCIVWVGKK